MKSSLGSLYLGSSTLHSRPSASGFLALTDHVIPGEVYTWVAVVVLPINSAVNPFLYTLTAIVKKKVIKLDII